MMHFYLLGSVHEWGSSVSPLISSVSVLLAHLHAAQTRPVCPGSCPQLPAAAPGLALVCCQRLCLPASDVSPCSPVLAPHGSGGWGFGHFDPDTAQNGRQWPHQWESVVPAEDTGDASHQNQTEDVWPQSCAARLRFAVKSSNCVFLWVKVHHSLFGPAFIIEWTYNRWSFLQNLYLNQKQQEKKHLFMCVLVT